MTTFRRMGRWPLAPLGRWMCAGAASDLHAYRTGAAGRSRGPDCGSCGEGRVTGAPRRTLSLMPCQYVARSLVSAFNDRFGPMLAKFATSMTETGGRGCVFVSLSESEGRAVDPDDTAGSLKRADAMPPVSFVHHFVARSLGNPEVKWAPITGSPCVTPCAVRSSRRTILSGSLSLCAPQRIHGSARGMLCAMSRLIAAEDLVCGRCTLSSAR